MKAKTAISDWVIVRHPRKDSRIELMPLSRVDHGWYEWFRYNTLIERDEYVHRSELESYRRKLTNERIYDRHFI